MKGFGKDDWVELFQEIGLDDGQMNRWHAAFERRHPEAHEGFLRWLGIPAAETESIRKASRGEWARG